MKRADFRDWNSIAWFQFVCCACWISSFCGCRTAVPIYVWQPGTFTCPRDARIAIAPIAGDEELAARVEQALLIQKPEARADLQLISSQELINHSPIRLVSATALQNDSSAIEAARKSSATLLLEGEILVAKLVDPRDGEPVTEGSLAPNEQLITSWRLIDPSSSKSVANQVVSLDTRRVDSDYPEMSLTHPNPTDRLIFATAKESWKAMAPSVAKDKVELMIPWLQIGAMRVRSGIVDAHNGRWDLAEQKFATATRWNPLNVAAHHNLAIAKVAGEDFSSAKELLTEVSWPFSSRLPHSSRMWLDHRERLYRAAHGLGKPDQGWLIPEPGDSKRLIPAEPIEIDELPWWTAIPMAKPPGWTWKAWLTQPWVL